MVIAVLGPAGTFSHELVLRLCKEEPLLLPTISQVFSLAERGEAIGFVPIENSEAGGVGPTLDGLCRYDVSITAECYLSVYHHLASHTQLEKIEVIYAHPQTHEQCSEAFDRLGIPVIHTSSNAASAVKAQENIKGAAAISDSAAAYYKIPIILRDLHNSALNTTRFIRIESTEYSGEDVAKCSIMIDPMKDIPGLLHALLTPFAERKINLSRIESRPSGRGIGSYRFFLDFEACPAARDALHQLKSSVPVREFGCYPQLEVPR